MKQPLLFKTLLVLAALLMVGTNVYAQFYADAYYVISDDGKTVTFYYDTRQESRGGTSFYGGTYSNPYASITKAVFDASFANSHPHFIDKMFYGCSSLTTIIGMENLNTDNVTSMYSMFDGCSSLTSIDLSNFNTSNVKDISSMFSGCSSLTTLDLSNFNTSNVTDMRSMFYGCSRLERIYAGDGWNTEKVTSSNYMFYECDNLVGGQGTEYDKEYLDCTYARLDGGKDAPGYFAVPGQGLPIRAYAALSDDSKTVTFYYDTQKLSRGGVNIFNNNEKNVYYAPYSRATTAIIDASFAEYHPTSTAYWFYNCFDLATITGLENLKTDNVTDMSNMFHWCNNLTSIDLSNFNTSNVTDMSNMFDGCSELTSLDLSSFNTSNVTNMEHMFDRCRELKTIYAGDGWSTEKVTKGDYMFEYCPYLVGGKGTEYGSNKTDYTYARIDGGKDAPGYFSVPGQEPYPLCYYVFNEDDMVLTFYYDSNKPERSGKGISPFSSASDREWNSKCGSITTVVFDESFANYTSLTSTAYWFYGMTNLTTITGIEYLKTDNVTDMNSMFRNCSSLTSIDVSGFKTDNVTNMRYMFYECSSLTSLDLSNFNTSNVTDMSSMFSRCSGLKTIYAGDGWSTENVARSISMFYQCTSLVGGQGTVYDSRRTDHTYARIDGGTDAPGYFTDKTASGIASIKADGIKAGPVYNLRGQHLAAPQKGINIVGGRKIIMK